MSDESRLDAWFLHEKLILGLLSEHSVAELARRIPQSGVPLAGAVRVNLFEGVLASYLDINDIPSLAVEHLHERLEEGQLVWLEQAVSFKGVGAARSQMHRGESGRASFSARLGTDQSFRVSGTFDVARLTSSTAVTELRGTRRQYIVGYVHSLESDRAELRAVAIGRRWLRPTPAIENWHPVDPAHVWPGAVDQFADVDFSQRVSHKDLDELRTLPEAKVKAAFAAILGEPVVPKDWGGEQFDLWTATRLSVEGQPLRTAFAFKGPSAFHPMVIADLGKNGDQIDRLAQTAADLIVVQHCHSITAPVVNMLKAYASSHYQPRRYMTIDGFQTVLILRHFGYL
jgi:hypothetical protein